MRFIFNFFFFGILFYLIWMFFPDAFKTLMAWADQLVAFFRDFFNSVSEKAHAPEEFSEPAKALFLVLPAFIIFKGLVL